MRGKQKNLYEKQPEGRDQVLNFAGQLRWLEGVVVLRFAATFDSTIGEQVSNFASYRPGRMQLESVYRYLLFTTALQSWLFPSHHDLEDTKLAGTTVYSID